MKFKIHTLLFLYSAFAFIYAAAGTIPPDLDLDLSLDPSLDEGMLGALEANGAKAHASTCRWTNCNENCPSGFVEVPRKSGVSGEMIWEHTQCHGHGLTKFCCPPHPDMTSCYWRGFSNSGKCTPGCAIRKGNYGAEVGTTTAGCTKSGYQSVCCTTPQSREATASVLAYYQCGWYSAGNFRKNEKRELCSEPDKSFACPEERPKLVADSNLGFGGEVECLEGLRSYCCAKDMLPIFKNCQWQPSCPNDQIRVAVRSDGGDKQAFCCAGEKTLKPTKPPAEPEPQPKPETKPDPRPDLEKTLLYKVRLFREYVDFWMNRRFGKDACPQPFQPPILDWYKYYQNTAASGLNATTDPNVVSSADTVAARSLSICERSWTAISDFLHVLTNVTTATFVGDEREQKYRILDRKLAKLPDCPGCHLSDFLRFVGKHPEYNTTAIIYDFLVKPKIALGEIQCTPGPDHFAPASVLEETAPDADAAALQRRRINQSLDPKDDPEYIVNNPDNLQDPLRRPHTVTIGRVLEAIDNGRLTLHYAQWLYSIEFIRPGPYLELAYWIGQTPGQVPDPAEESNLRLDELRDRRPFLNNAHSIDRWVILHLHLDNSAVMRNFMFSQHTVAVPNDLRGTTTRTFTNIASITFFHAHTWTPRRDHNGNVFMWNIDWNDRNPTGRNNGRVLNCRDDSPGNSNGLPQSYPTIPVGPGRIIGQSRIVDPHWAPGTAFYNVFTNLYNQGYLSYTAFEPIFNEPQPFIRNNAYHLLDVNPASINAGFETRRRNETPQNAERMLGHARYELEWDPILRGSTPWGSPFLIGSSPGTGAPQLRPVTQLPNFPSGVPPPPPPPPPPGPPPPQPPGPPPGPPPGVPPGLPQAPFIGPQLLPSSSQAPLPTGPPPQPSAITHSLDGPQPLLPPPQPSKTPDGDSWDWRQHFFISPPSGEVVEEPNSQGLNSTTSNTTRLTSNMTNLSSTF